MEREERRSLGSVRSVERAGGVLRLFLSERRGVAVTEVAESLDVSNSTAHRLLRSLCATGLLEQNSPQGAMSCRCSCTVRGWPPCTAICTGMPVL